MLPEFKSTRVVTDWEKTYTPEGIKLFGSRRDTKSVYQNRVLQENGVLELQAAEYKALFKTIMGDTADTADTDTAKPASSTDNEDRLDTESERTYS